MFWWILYVYLASQAFIVSAVLLVLLRDKLKAYRAAATHTNDNAIGEI